jgi:TPR repeat protein
MLGNYMGRGIGFTVNLEEAKKFLALACELDPDSQGCEYAKKNMDGIRRLEAEQSGSDQN